MFALPLTLVLSAGLAGGATDVASAQQRVTAQTTATVGTHVREAAASRATTPRVVLTASDDERGFIDKYVPFMIADELHPDVDQNLVAMYIVFLLAGEFAGPLWIPKLFVDLDPGPDYTTEALILWISHTAAFVLSIFPGFYLCGTGLIGALIWALYLNPVAYINSFNHHVIVENGMGGKNRKKKSKKRKGRRGAMLSLPAMPQLATSTAAAY